VFESEPAVQVTALQSSVAAGRPGTVKNKAKTVLKSSLITLQRKTRCNRPIRRSTIVKDFAAKRRIILEIKSRLQIRVLRWHEE